jgi:hypothetical protein
VNGESIEGDRGRLNLELPSAVTTAGAESQLSPALRFLARAGRVTSCRPAVVAGGLLSRAGLLAAVSLWPDGSAPVVAMNPIDTAAARWMPRAFPDHRRLVSLVDNGTWQALRARTLLVGATEAPSTIVAAERALGRQLHEPGVALFSPGAAVAKVTCFVLETGAAAPTVVVKTMTDPRNRARLRDEMALVEGLRARLSDAPGIAAALPAPPLACVSVGGDEFFVEQFDELATEVGGADRRSQAMAWLARFQRTTTTRWRAWDDEDDHAAIATVHAAAEFAADVQSVAAAVRSRLTALRGSSVPRCAVHGDFWCGNIGQRDGRVRVFDWEWGSLEGDPFVDLWMFELGALRQAAMENGPGFTNQMRQAVEHVETGLAGIGVDSRFALAMGPSVVAHVTGRIRQAIGQRSAWERTARAFLDALQRLMT